MATADRRALMDNAVAFLRDPASQSSSFAQRVQFLEAKGLAPGEIEQVMRQVSVQNLSTPYPQYSAQYPIPGIQRQPLDWRDYFIMAVVSGSFMYGAVSLARKYLLPHLKPPSSTVYEDDRDALTAQFDAAESLLKEIQAETAGMREAVESQKQKVDDVTEEIQAAVAQMREGERKSRDEMREIRDEINSIREMLPKMIEKNKESQSNSLAELQQELKSLKALLLSRGPSFPSSTSPAPGLPTFATGRPSIPAWQLAGSSIGAQNAMSEAASSEQNASTSIQTPIPILSTFATGSSTSIVNGESLSQPESL